MTSENQEYYQQRAEYHQLAARRAPTKQIAALHRQLAERYAALIELSTAPELRVIEAPSRAQGSFR